MAPFVALNEVSKLYQRGRQSVAVLEKFNLDKGQLFANGRAVPA